MATGYKIIEPSGSARILTEENPLPDIQGLQDRWGAYCERNWLNDSGDQFSPEMKVKTFLDGIAYLLMAGNRDGIETDYKRIMHAKREIPESSCPSSVRNIMYASGAAPDSVAIEEVSQFAVITDLLDAAAERYEVRKPVWSESKFQKKQRLGIHGGEWCRVDTDGYFRVGNNLYVISHQAVQYQPIHTEYGDYYAMDRILASGGKFYDMNYDEVEVFQAGGIVSRDESPWGNDWFEIG